MKRIILMIALLGLTGCPRTGDKCTPPGALRCDGTKIQFCDGKKLWVTKLDCKDKKLVCGPYKDRFTCIKEKK